MHIYITYIYNNIYAQYIHIYMCIYIEPESFMALVWAGSLYH